MSRGAGGVLELVGTAGTGGGGRVGGLGGGGGWGAWGGLGMVGRVVGGGWVKFGDWRLGLGVVEGVGRVGARAGVDGVGGKAV